MAARYSWVAAALSGAAASAAPTWNGRLGALDSQPALTNAGSPANASTQIVELGAAHMTVAQHLDLVHAWRVEHEGALDADAMRRHGAR